MHAVGLCTPHAVVMQVDTLPLPMELFEDDSATSAGQKALAGKKRQAHISEPYTGFGFCSCLRGATVLSQKMH